MRNPTTWKASTDPLTRDQGKRHRGNLRTEKVAFGVIKGLSYLTIALLALIVGFILYRGLRYSNELRSAFLPYAETEPEGLALVVNADNEIRVLDFEVTFGMFTDEYINWSKISAEEGDLIPVAVDPETEEGGRVEKFLFGASTLEGDPEGLVAWGGLVQTLPRAEDALRFVAENPGAVTLVSATALDEARRAGMTRLATVPIRRLVVAVNEDVTALVDNRVIEDLDDGAIDRLLAGTIHSWQEVGGPDLPVVLLAPPESTSLASVAGAAEHSAPPGAEVAPDEESYIGSIADTPGAVGLLFSGEAARAELSTLTRKSRETGWNLSLRYLVEPPRLSGRVGGISTIILNTFFMLILTVLVAAPIGVAAAVYLIEYARQGLLIRILRLGTETLAGIPSIIFGLFGFLFFVDILHFGFGLMSGCLTLTLMILPTIVRTSEEALKAVPQGLREGSLALGATKLQTIFRVVVPAASPGILTGLILGVGRAVGETAALLFTLGSDYKLAKGLFSSARVLSSHVYLLFAEGISFDRAFSTATVLIVMVLFFNFVSRRFIERMNRQSS